MHNYEVVEDRETDEKIFFRGETDSQDGTKIGLDLDTSNVSASGDQDQQNSVEDRWSSLRKSCDTLSSNQNKTSPFLPEPVEGAKRKCETENENVYEADGEGSSLLNWSIPEIFPRKEASIDENKVPKTSISELKIALEPEPPSGKILIEKRIRTLADVFFTVFVIAPMVVGNWRGHWRLMDKYLETFSIWGCFLLGVGLHIIFAVLRYHLHAKFDDKSRNRSLISQAVYHIFRLTYTYIFSAACILQWRGGWAIFDHYTFHTWMMELATVVCLLLLTRLRCVRTLLAAPFLVGIDKYDYVFKFSTRFKLNTRDWTLYILDCAFSVGVVGTLVVFVWRGVWASFDLYLFPGNPEYSAVGSVVIGYTIVVITFSLQPVMRWACTRLDGIPRLIVADIFILLSFMGTVNVWRGIWNVLELWFLPQNPELSCWITHLGCFMFLVLLNCSNSILVRGVLIDAEEENGKCVIFPCHYLRLLFKIEREKKEARRQNLVVASRNLATIMERPGKEGNGSVLSTPDPLTVVESPESHV